MTTATPTRSDATDATERSIRLFASVTESDFHQLEDAAARAGTDINDLVSQRIAETMDFEPGSVVFSPSQWRNVRALFGNDVKTPETFLRKLAARSSILMTEEPGDKGGRPRHLASHQVANSQIDLLAIHAKQMGVDLATYLDRLVARAIASRLAGRVF